MGLRLTYLPVTEVDQEIDETPAQPVALHTTHHKRPQRLVPVRKPHPEIDYCCGCVAWTQEGCRTAPVDCMDLPDCTTCVYVRATPENKLRYIEWRLENDK